MISVLHLGLTDYGTALRLQQSLVELRKQGRISDVLLLLEHPPVVTLGRNASQKNLLASPEALQKNGVELFESNRGGDVTFHGPGQLVGYPIFDLRGFSPRLGAIEFVRRMEEALIRTCGDMGIPSQRICGLTGVWTQGSEPKERAVNCSEFLSRTSDEKKIAAIGVHISRGITSHGFALNVNADLEYFKLIVPCGISDRAVTSIAQELIGRRIIPTMAQVAHAVSLNFGRVFERQMLWLDSLDSLLATAAQFQDEESSPRKPDSIGVPLSVPEDLRRIRREQQPGSVDEAFLA
jgi:lipoyl(octanoyl) transferase